jgi:hypothetical protein
MILENPVVFQAVAGVNISGAVTFNNTLDLTSGDYLYTSDSSDVVTFLNTMQGSGNLNVNGPGKVYMEGSVASTDTMTLYGLPGYTAGTVILDGNLAGGANQIIVDAGTVVLEGDGGTFGNPTMALNGTGGINVMGGAITTDITQVLLGARSYSGPITLAPGIVATDYDPADTLPFGTGTMTLNSATIQNLANLNTIGGGTISRTGVSNPIVSTGNSLITAGSSRFKLNGPVNISSGTMTVSGDVALLGGLSGTGSITLQTTTDTLEVSGTNTGYTGRVFDNGGTILVSATDSLGPPRKPTNNGFIDFFAGGITKNQQAGEAGKFVTGTIADPIVDNPIVVENGTLVIDGLLTFPAGITIDTGAAIEIEGAGSQVVSSGTLTGAGTIIVEPGATFSTPGGTSGFTGSVQMGGGLIVPTLTVTDAGGPATGSPYPATATLTALGVTPSSSLEGVSPTYEYYAGSSTMGVGSSTAPSAAGIYTVVGSFAGSTDYAPTTSTPITFTITSTATEKLVFSTEPRSTDAGGLGTVIVKIENSSGQVVKTDNSTVTLTVGTGPGALSGKVSVKAVNGVATFDHLILTTAGTYTLDATDGQDTAAVSNSFKISPAEATKIVFVTEPSDAQVNQSIGTITVDVEDRYGNVESGFNGYVSLWVLRDWGWGPIFELARVKAAAGVATFNNVSVGEPGTYQLAAITNEFAFGFSDPFTISGKRKL